MNLIHLFMLLHDGVASHVLRPYAGRLGVVGTTPEEWGVAAVGLSVLGAYIIHVTRMGESY